jgi:hypothetical protein
MVPEPWHLTPAPADAGLRAAELIRYVAQNSEQQGGETN